MLKNRVFSEGSKQRPLSIDRRLQRSRHSLLARRSVERLRPHRRPMQQRRQSASWNDGSTPQTSFAGLRQKHHQQPQHSFERRSLRRRRPKQ